MSGKFQINREDFPFITHKQVNAYERELDVKCAIKVGKGLIKNAKRADKKFAKILKKRKEEKKPFWWKILTHHQVAAADSIFGVLQAYNINDEVKGITHLVINGLHVKKKPSERVFIECIDAAKKSDLALLWNLYVKFYQTRGDFWTKKKFTYDERVILSSIAHLDMMTTLRKLDKIIPKPVDESGKTIRDIVKILTPEPKLKIYEQYKNSFHVIENEENRWFKNDGLIIIRSDCDDQKKEPTKLEKFLNCLKNEEEDSDSDINLNHFSENDRKYANDIKAEFKKAENDFKQQQNHKQAQIINSSLVNQLVDDAFSKRYLHLCGKCENSTTNQKSKLQLKERLETSYDPTEAKYFHRPSINSSVKFDYEQIFSLHFLPDHGRDVVKKSINSVLELNKYLTVDNAITACLRDMWCVKLHEWNEKRQAEIEERQRRVVADCSGIGADKRRLFELLRQGIALMRNDRKFVLAALPHSYRLPILKEWILRRFHVRYDFEDCIWGNKQK